MFPWQFQKHPVPDELQMSSRCVLQQATLAGFDRSTPPLLQPPRPPFGAQSILRWRLNMVKLKISPSCGCKEFLIDSLPTLSASIAVSHYVQGFQSESVFLRVTQDAFFYLTAKNRRPQPLFNSWDSSTSLLHESTMIIIIWINANMCNPLNLMSLFSILRVISCIQSLHQLSIC